jgi:ABC-type sugar transport system ATPase subunit
LETAEADISTIINLMVGRIIYEAAPEIPERSDEVVLDVRHLTRGRMVRDVSFVLHRGEILGVAGLVGAGRTEVVRTIFGADTLESGEIWVKGRRVEMQPDRRGQARHRLSVEQALRASPRRTRFIALASPQKFMASFGRVDTNRPGPLQSSASKSSG